LDVDNDLGDEIFARKKAWAELEREQNEVKSNIKSLMRKAPESVEMDNPLLAGRMSNKSS
jgi:archaellum component FlaC